MKKILILHMAYLLQDVLNRRLLLKQTGSGSTENHHPSFLRSGIGQKKTVRCSQNLWRRRKMLLKQETQQSIVNGLLGFITEHLYSAGSACVLTIIA